MEQQLTGDKIIDHDSSGSDDRATASTSPGLDWAREPHEHLFEKVERAKQEWEATADSLPELVCLVDNLGRIVRANRTIETWGLSQVTAIQGLDFHTLIHPDCAGLFCALDRFLQRARKKACEGQPDELETYDPILGRHLLVRVRPVSGRQPMTDNTVVVVVQDVTEHRQAEQTLHRYNQRLMAMNEIQKAILAAHSPEEIAQAALSRIRQLVPFRQARITLFRPESDEFLVLVAYADGSIHLRPGQSFPRETFKSSKERQPDKFFVIGDLATLSAPSAMEQQLLKEGIRSYISIPLAAEREFIGSLSLGAEQPVAFDLVHIEIAQEVANLLAIAIRQAQLYSRLRQANMELQEALQAKEQMIHNVSHELRTPLTMIHGYTELLGDASLGPLTGEQERALQVMSQQEARLRFMVERLLALQTLDAQKPQLELLDLGAWLRQAIHTWEIRTVRAVSGVPFRLEIPGSLPSLMADPDLLGQVIVNLLDNAVKFSPQGSLRQVRAWQEGAQVIIAVSDDGIGIPSDKQQQLFERFYQVDGSATRHFGGMGIGLALCRVIVEAHDGRIWVESPGEGQGSTFYIALPVDRKEELDYKE